MKNNEILRTKCKFYEGIEWSSVVPAIRRDSRTLQREDYLRLAHQHRFCLAAPGDFISTPKISEFIAIGAAGGCIPVFIVPDSDEGPSLMLPFADTLDYCSFAFLVRSSTARSRPMRAVVRRLSRVTAEEAALKLVALKRAYHAFVWRHESGVSKRSRPSAVDHVLSAACAAAKGLQLRANEGGAERVLGDRMRGAGVASDHGSHKRCYLQ